MKLFENGVLEAVADIKKTYEAAAINYNIHGSDGGMENPAEKDWIFYKNNGRSAIELILQAMVISRKSEINAILDMPAGYGRVARHLVAAFPKASLTCCEIIEEAAFYCAQQFKCTPLFSRPDFENFEYPQKYDLIWCGSLFSHLPENRFRSGLDLFSRSLAPGGLAVVTMHGRHSSTFGSVNYLAAEAFRAARDGYDKRGFGFVNYPGSPPSFIDNYGVTLSSPSFVMDVLASDETIRVLAYHERGWDDHQDVLIFQKQPIMNAGYEKTAISADGNQ